jgi:hypothetical protein
MTGSALAAQATNSSFVYRQIIRSSSFRYYFLLKNIFIEPTPTPPCSQRFGRPFFEPSPQLGEGRVRGPFCVM